MHRYALKGRTVIGRIGRWLADGQAPGSIDLVRLARSRSQPPRSPRRYRPDRQADRGLEFCAACGGTRSAWTGTRPARWSRRRRRPGAGHRGRGAVAAAQCRARRRGLRRRHRRPRRGLRPPGDPGGPQGRPEGEDPAHRGHRGGPGCLPGRPGSQRRSARLAAADGSPCWPPPVGGSARLTSGSWCAAWPAPPGSARGSSSRRAACATWRSPSPWTPGPPCATSRITPAAKTPHHPPV